MLQIWCPLLPFTENNLVVFTIFTTLYNHYLLAEYLHHPVKNPNILYISHSFSCTLSFWQLLTYFLSPWICLLWTFHVDRVIKCAVLCLGSLSLLSSLWTCTVASIRLHSSLWPNNILLCAHTYTFCSHIPRRWTFVFFFFFTFWLLWIKLLWIFMYKVLFLFLFCWIVFGHDLQHVGS